MFGEYRMDGNLIKTQILQDFAIVSLVPILYCIKIGVCIFVKYGILSTTRLWWLAQLWVIRVLTPLTSTYQFYWW